MLRKNLIGWNDFIKFTHAGIVLAEYTEIRAAITERFKQIYGQDIDISTGTADGVYIETYSMIIHNILQAFKLFYGSLDVRTAQGKYLEMLSMLSNVSRKGPTASTAVLTLTLSDEEVSDYTTNQMSFLDKSGTEWIFNSPQIELVLQPGVPQTIVVTCSQLGPIRADAGWIDRTLLNDAVIDVVQSNAANIGSYGETDSQLRARRNQSLGATGNTVLESLAGALLELTGIDDVKIYNNDSVNALTAKDTTTIQPHAVYVILRKRPNIEIADSLIGSLIYEKMTPGIPTTETDDSTTGVSKTYEYMQYILGEPVETGFAQQVYWKDAIPLNPTIEIVISTLENFASANNSTATLIANAVMSYMNNIQLSTDVMPSELTDVVRDADPRFRGRRTFNITSIKIDGDTALISNTDTYFEYTIVTITPGSGSVTIELS